MNQPTTNPTTTRPEEVTEMATHIDTCTTGPNDTEFVDGRTEYHDGPDRCPACDEDMASVHEAEAYAEFGMGWVTSGGDPADAGAAFHQHEAHVAEMEARLRSQPVIEDGLRHNPDTDCWEVK